MHRNNGRFRFCFRVVFNIKKMKPLTLLLTTFILGVLLTSCLNVDEEIWIESDGSGHYESTTDLSALLPIISMGMQQKADNTEEGNPMDVMMEKIFSAENMDTLLNFGDLMNETLAEKGLSWEMMLDSMQQLSSTEVTTAQQEALLDVFETVSAIRMRLQVNKNEPLLKTTNIQDFTHVDQLSSLTDAIQKITTLMDEDEGSSSPFGANGSDVIFEQLFGGKTIIDLEGDVLRVRRTGIDISLLGEEFEQNFAMVKMLLGNKPYRLTIHFPGKVKKISSDLIKKIDKKSVMIEIPLNELFDPEMQLDASIVFKGLKK